MEPYVVAIVPVVLATFFTTFGWIITRMIKLAEIQSNSIAKLESFSSDLTKQEQRIDALVASRFLN